MNNTLNVPKTKKPITTITTVPDTDISSRFNWKKVGIILGIFGLFAFIAIPYIPFTKPLPTEVKIANAIKKEILTNPNLVGHMIIPLEELRKKLLSREAGVLRHLETMIASLEDGELRNALLSVLCQFVSGHELCGGSEMESTAEEEVIIYKEEKFLNMSLEGFLTSTKSNTKNTELYSLNLIQSLINHWEIRTDYKLTRENTVKDYIDILLNHPEFLRKTRNIGAVRGRLFLNTIKKYAPETYAKLYPILQKSYKQKHQISYLPEPLPEFSGDYIEINFDEL